MEIDERILAAGRALFLADGFAVCSMEAIAALAGVSKGTLYARYSNKADLFRAITRDRMRAWSQMLPQRDKAGPLAQRLRRRALAVLAGMHLPEVRAFERLAASEIEAFPELGRDFYEHGYRAIVESTRSDFEAESARQQQPVQAAVAVAEIFASSLIGWYRIESAMRAIETSERDAFVDRLVDMCIMYMDLKQK